MSRGFEIIEGFEDIVSIPERSTKYSAGYDIAAANHTRINPGEMKVVDTGITAYMEDDEVLKLFIRSGLAKNHRLALQNQVGIIDADFYKKHIKLLVKNEGEETFWVKPGDRLVQGIFQGYLITDDDKAENEREGGLGHTGIRNYNGNCASGMSYYGE